MRKLILFILILVSVQVFGQNPTNYTYRASRERVISSMVDSMFRVPRYNGTPSGLRVSEVAIDGAIAMDTTNNRLYIYSGGAWIRLAAFSEIGAYVGNVGSGYRLVIPNTNTVKTLGANYGIILDSVTSNQIGIKADTATLFPAVRATISSGSASPDTVNIIIFGQSNAGGATGPTAWDTAANSNVLIWNHAIASPAWQVAHINQRPFRTAGYNSYASGYPNSRTDLNGSANEAFYLGKFLASQGKVVKIVMAPGDGLSINNWRNATGGRDRMMDSIESRITASGMTRVDLAIWHQGEGDGATAEATYLASFDSIKAELRSGGYIQESTPIVAVGLLSAKKGQGVAWVKDTTLRKLDYNSDVWDGYASSDSAGTWSGGENVHFGASALDTLADRIYAAWKALPAREHEKKDIRYQMLFKVGETNAPGNGDSILYDSRFSRSHLDIWRNGVLQYPDTLAGISRWKGLVAFHPTLSTNDKIEVHATDSTKWNQYAVTAVPDSLNINFDPVQNLQVTNGIWTITTAGGFNTHLGVADFVIPANTGGRVVFKHTGTGASGMVLGFATTSTITSYGGITWAVHIGGGTDDLYDVQTGSFTSHGTVSTNDYVAIGRFGATIKIQTSTDKVTWSDVFTFPTGTTAQLWIKLDQATDTLPYPQLQFKN